MDFLNQAMLYLLQTLKGALGSYSLAIIGVTALIRAVLWPLNTAQMKSMQAMQVIQPKMKAIQEKHKDNPVVMQQEIMKLYSENKFNPFAGCLPMLLQLPIFIALYGSLSSPAFMALAGNESFFFVKHLSHTLQSSGGEVLDGKFAVTAEHNQFTIATPDKVVIKLKGVAEPQTMKVSEFRITDANKLITFEPRPVIAGEPIQFNVLQTDLDFSNDYMKKVDSVEVTLKDPKSNEIENVVLKPSATQAGLLTASVDTIKAVPTWHWDVFTLIALYGVLTWAYQQSMTWVNGKPKQGEGDQDKMQAMMMKFMPLMFTVLMFIIPIPAGVMLYLLVTMLMMLAQNAWIAFGGGKNNTSAIEKPAEQVVNL
jgi:YidC/Oxa1 family membrane protein insertase